MPYALAILLCLALLLLLFDSSSLNDFSIQNTQGEPKNETQKLTSSSGDSQSGLNELRQNSSDTNRTNLLTDTDKGDHDGDLSHYKSIRSSLNNVDVTVNDEATNQFAAAENDETLPTDSVRGLAFNKQTAAKPVPLNPGAMTEDLPIVGGKELSGQVQNTEGQPISGVAIHLYPQNSGSGSLHGRSSYQVQSDLTGEFVFKNLVDIDYRLIISEQDDYESVSYNIRAGTSELVVVLSEKQFVTIKGLVSDDNEQPIAGVRVSINGIDEFKTDLDGHYHIRKTFTLNSSFRLGFTHDRYRELNEIVRISSNSITINKQLPAKNELSLTGQIINDYGTPLPGASVWLYSGSANIERRTKSNNDGYFNIEDLKSDSEYQFSVSYPGHDKFALKKLIITQLSRPMRIELTALSNGSVTGMIVDSTGYPMPNYAMTIISGSADAKMIASNNEGVFESVNVYEGELRVSSVSVPRTTVSGIALQAGQDLFLKLIVDHGDFEISGRVTDESGLVIADAQIKLYWSHTYEGLNSSSTRFLKSDTQGDFRFQNLGPGSHTLTVSADGYQNKSVNIISEQQIGPMTITIFR